jgi:5'-3' exonuclease
VHLIDGTYELFRAHFSKRPDVRSTQGQNRKAVFGLVSSLLSLLQDPEESVTHVAVAFDRPIRSFRNDLFDGYKTEEGVDPELLAQFEPAEEATRALGVTAWVMDEFEADDALATAAARFALEGAQVRLFSPDKDLLQCLQGDQVVRIDRQRQKLATEASLRAERGFGPRSIPDFLALVGDTADGIPGIDGFGERTASSLLARYEQLENIPHSAAQWEVAVRGAPTLSATLRAHWDDALLYRRLATLRTDVPLPETLEALRFQGVPREPFTALCRELGSESLAARPTRWR